MKKLRNPDYGNAIIERLKLVMELAGLEISGFSVLTDLSESQIYSLLSGRRTLTEKVAIRIGESLGFNGLMIFNLQQDIPEGIKRSDNLKKFSLKYKDNHEYFIDTKIDRKPAYFLEFEVLSTNFFNKPKYVWEVNDFCKELGRKFISDKLKKYLNYFVTISKLKSEKRPIKLRKGGFGQRMVDVFWK